MTLPAAKKIFSFLYPVTIKVVSNPRHQELTLQLFCNQYLLSTSEAVYSFGTFYAPFRKSFASIKDVLPKCKSFLLLGTGLGSALKILQQKYHIFPRAVLVDNDKDILEMSMMYMDLNSKKNVTWQYSDANTYMQTTEDTFDLIGVDLFKDTLIPRDFKQSAFFEQCKKKLNPNGYCIFNMILNSTNEKNIILERLQQNFDEVKEIKFKVNTFFVCHVADVRGQE